MPPLPPRRKPKWGRIAVVVGAVMGLLAIVGVACGVQFARGLDNRLDRTDAFSDLTDGRPAKLVDGALNVLVIGSDGRAPGQDPGVDGERSDALMVLHVEKNHDKAYAISIPRDTVVDIPKHKGEGGKKAKINAAHAWGGIPLTIKTVERFTNIKIDNVIKVDFAGFKTMTDALSGVDVYVDATVTDPRSKRTFKQGWNHLDGDAALDYVRQRYGLKDGDFDRMKRQQIFMRALLKKATASGTLSSPKKLKKFLEAAADSMTVDKDFSLFDMAVQFRKIRMSNVFFVTMPTDGFGMVNGQSVVLPDKDKTRTLFSAVARDEVGDWLKDNPPNDADKGR